MMRWCVALLLLVGFPRVLAGQYLGDRELSPEARISLITIYPGEPLYTLFGHTAIRIRDPLQGLDLVYNYGTFDFEDEGFYWKFVRGQLNYFLSRTSFARVFPYYREVEQRSIVEQELRLSRTQRQAVFHFLEENYRPENRYYRYDFFWDNCATRVRDVFERVLADSLAYPEEVEPPAPTFRRLLDPYLAGRPLTHLGIDLVLGAPADREASLRDAYFLPLILMQGLGASRIRTAKGWQPLVARTDTLFWAGGTGLPEPVLPWPALLLWAVCILTIALDLKRGIEGRVRAVERGKDGLLFGLVGLIGTVLVFLVLGTEHAVASPNWNLLWAWPTHLLVAVLIFRWASEPPAWARMYLIAGSVAAVLVLTGWKWIPQALPFGLFPLILLLAWRAVWMAGLYRWFRVAPGTEAPASVHHQP